MKAKLHGLRVAVIGGDQREWEVIAALKEAGAVVRCVGLPEPRWATAPVVQSRDLESALSGCQAAIAPLSGTDVSGMVRRCAPDSPPLRLDARTLGLMAPGGVLFIGAAVPAVRHAAQQAGIQVVETENDDELAILNSIPTAEGAVQLAMQRMPITLHGSRCVVLGFGRCGETLAWLLHRMGAHVCVVARNPAQRARVETLGLQAVPLEELTHAVRTADAIFNTIPALILTREPLAATRPHVVIIDIAAEPGGVDFEAAQALEREAHLALGLPGKVAPLTAGKILSRCVLRMLAERFGGTEEGRMDGRAPAL